MLSKNALAVALPIALSSLPVLSMAVVLTMLTSCREPQPDNTSGCTDDWFEAYLNRSDPPAGIADSSLACYSEGEFNDDQPDVACQVEFTGQTALYDYQDQEGRAGAIQLAAGPGLEGVDEAATLTAGEDGFVEATLTQCTPVSYKTTRDEAMPTYHPNQVFAPKDPFEPHFQSVSNGSRGLLQLTFGQSIEDGNGAIVGRALACDDEPLANAQVVIRDAECNVPATAFFGYFTAQLPDVFRGATSDDGVFAIFNVPPGIYTVDMFLRTDGSAEGNEHVLAASSTVDIRADSISISDLFVGDEDGVHYPASCRGTCSP